jgi:hypothetical protein
MKSGYRYLAVLSSIVLVCCGALILNQSVVSAAGEGKITGTVRLRT